ncbi:MAG: ABC transporter permease [Oscillospiraceae bacterium]
MIVFGVLTILSAVCFILFFKLGDTLEAQNTAERFKGESELRFSQVTAFFPAGEGIDEEKVYGFETSLDAKLIEASLEAPEGGSLYIDAYSASGQLSVTGEKGSADVKVIGVGGDFFQFHPLRLRSGSYISGSDLMQDRVILDEELAWRLFGGMDLAGMQVTIGGKPYIIAGVVSREDDFASERTYTDGPGMFMSYSALNAINETKISCYELVSADPVSGFIMGELESAFSAADTVENSSRFSLGSIFSILTDFGTRSIRNSAVAYPYWENAARLVEDVLALVLLFAVLFAIMPAVTAIVVLWQLARHGTRKLKRWVPEYLERRSEERYERRRQSGGKR